MKINSERKRLPCNNTDSEKCLVVTKWKIRSWSTVYVSFCQTKLYFNNEFSQFHFKISEIFDVKSNATRLKIFSQILVINRTLTMLAITLRRQVREQKKVNKTKSSLSKFFNYLNAKIRNREPSNNLFNNTLLSGDIEANPGPNRKSG